MNKPDWEKNICLKQCLLLSAIYVYSVVDWFSGL